MDNLDGVKKNLNATFVSSSFQAKSHYKITSGFIKEKQLVQCATKHFQPQQISTDILETPTEQNQ